MIETVVVTNQSYTSELCDKMGLRGHVLISQQISNSKKLISFERVGSIRKVISNSSGIGANRNIALNYSLGDICILADDDMVFYENYIETVKRAYEELPDADVIIFDLDGRAPLNMDNKRPSKVHRYNYMRFGAARFTFRRESIRKYGIGFNEYFGASTFGSGEDTLFLKDCLSKRLNLYYYPKTLAKLCNTRDSSWFDGYNEKYYFDKGALYYALSPRFYKILLLRHLFKMRKKNVSTIKFLELYQRGLAGADYFKKIGK